MEKTGERDDTDENDEQRPTRPQHEHAADALHRLKAEQRQKQQERDESGGRRRAQCPDEIRPHHALRRFRHHTFSTSGRPKMPCGRKIIVTARIEKVATSL